MLAGLLNGDLKGKVDLIYIDPPFNTNQTFTVTSNRVSTISRGKDGIIAYSDQLNEEQYLEFMRERLVLLKELLSDRGSIYIHIDSKIGHYLKIIMDEIFGKENFKNDISRIKSNPKNFSRKAYGNQKDMILFYSKNFKNNIFNDITISLTESDKVSMFSKIDENGNRYNTVPVHAPGETTCGCTGKEWKGMLPPKGRHWRTDPSELDLLDQKNLIEWSKNGVPRIKKYANEHKGKKIQDVWEFKDPMYPKYPTEKNSEMLKLIIEQSSKENSIVLDCFAGSGTTLDISQKLGRYFIGIDYGEFSIEIIKKRLGLIQYIYQDFSESKTKM